MRSLFSALALAALLAHPAQAATTQVSASTKLSLAQKKPICGRINGRALSIPQPYELAGALGLALEPQGFDCTQSLRTVGLYLRWPSLTPAPTMRLGPLEAEDVVFLTIELIDVQNRKHTKEALDDVILIRTAPVQGEAIDSETVVGDWHLNSQYGFGKVDYHFLPAHGLLKPYMVCRFAHQEDKTPLFCEHRIFDEERGLRISMAVSPTLKIIEGQLQAPLDAFIDTIIPSE